MISALEDRVKKLEGAFDQSGGRINQHVTGINDKLQESERSVQSWSSVFVRAFQDPIGSVEDLTSRLSEELTQAFSAAEGVAGTFFNVITTGAAIALVAVTAIITAIAALGEKGSEVENVEEGFNRLAGGVKNASDILDAMKEGVKGTIDELNLMKDANHLLAVGFQGTADDFKTITSAAMVLSHQGFGSVTEELNAVDRAMETGRATRLGFQGVTVDTKAAEEKYALSLGITSTELNRQQKLHADQIAIVEALRKKVVDAGDQEVTFAERLAQVKVDVEDTTDAIARQVAISPVLITALDAIGEAFNEAFGGTKQTLINTIIDLVERFALGFIEASRYVVSAVGSIGKIWNEILVLWDGVKAGWDAIVYVITLGLLTIEQGMNHLPFVNLSKSIDGLSLEVDRWYNNMANAQKGIAANQKAQEDWDTSTKQINATLDVAAAKMQAQLKLREDYRAKTEQVGFVEGGLAPWLQKTNDLTQQGSDRTGAFTKAVEKFVEQLEGETKQTKEMSAALDIVIARQQALGDQRDPDVTQREIDMIDKLLAKHVQLTAQQEKEWNAFNQFGTYEVKLADTLSKAWNDYYNQLGALQGQTLEQMNTNSNAWYANEFANLQREAKDHPAAWEKLGLLNAQLYLKYEQNAQKWSNEEQKIQDEVTKGWDDYYSVVDKDSGTSLDAQIAGVQKWYDASYQAISNEAKTHEDAWARLEPLNATFYAKLDKASFDYYKTQQKYQAETDVMWQQTSDTIDGIWGATLDKQIAKTQEWRDKTIAALDYTKEGWQDRLNAIEALYKAKIQALVVANDPLLKATATVMQDIQKGWIDTFDKTLADTGNFKDAFVAVFDSIRKDVMSIWAGMISDFLKGFIQPWLDDLSNAAKQFGQIIHDAVTGVASKLTGGGGLLSGLGGGGAAAAGSTTTAGSVAAAGGATIAGGEAANLSLGAVEGAGTAGISAATLASITGGESTVAGGGVAAITGGATMATSLALGAVTMGIGVAIPFIIAGFKKLFSGTDWTGDVARDAGSKFGMQFSDSLIKQIAADAKNMNSEAGAELLHLGDIISEAGGVTAKNFDTFAASTHDLFSAIQLGWLTTAQASKTLDAVFPELAAAGTDAYGRINDKIKTLITLDQQFGTQSKAIADFLKTQAESSVDDFNAIVAGTKDAVIGYDSVKKAVDDAMKSVKDLTTAGTTSGATWDRAQQTLTDALTAQHQAGLAAQQELDDLATQATATIAAAVNAGDSLADAISKAGPGLDALIKGYKDLGLTSDNALFNALSLQRQIQQNAPELVAAVGAIGKEMVALDNIGEMNVNTFGAMQRTGMEMYTRLQDQVSKAGGTTKDALLPMQDYLHQAQIEATNLGTSVDDNTQMLIDQSKELGIWKDTGKTATDKLTDAINHLSNVLLGIPDDASTAAAGIVNSFGNLKIPPVHVPTVVDAPIPGGNDTALAAMGGLVSRDSVMHLASGGFASSNWAMPMTTFEGTVSSAALPAPPMAFDTTQGSDIVPTMLSAGERVLSPPQTQAFDSFVSTLRAALSAPKEPSASLSPPQTQAFDSSALRAALSALKEPSASLPPPQTQAFDPSALRAALSAPEEPSASLAPPPQTQAFDSFVSTLHAALKPSSLAPPPQTQAFDPSALRAALSAPEEPYEPSLAPPPQTQAFDPSTLHAALNAPEEPSASLSSPPQPVQVNVFLDNRQIATAVFDVGSSDVARRKGSAARFAQAIVNSVR